MFPDLRRESAQRTVELDFPGYAIGGLSVGEPRPMTYEMVDAAMRFLPEDKPRYLMGVGTPEEIVHYVGHGRGHDGLRAAHARRAPRAAVHLGGRLTIKNARYAATRARWTRTAVARSAPAIRGLTCGTCMRPTKCWRRC